MKIGYDAKRAIENQTGLGNYSRDLINTYSLLNPKFQILLFASKIFQNKRFLSHAAKNNSIDQMCIHLCASSPSASHLTLLSSRHKTAFINCPNPSLIHTETYTITHRYTQKTHTQQNTK